MNPIQVILIQGNHFNPTEKIGVKNNKGENSQRFFFFLFFQANHLLLYSLCMSCHLYCQPSDMGTKIIETFLSSIILRRSWQDKHKSVNNFSIAYHQITQSILILWVFILKRDSEELQATLKNSKELQGTLRNSKELRGTAKNSEKLKRTLRNSEKL